MTVTLQIFGTGCAKCDKLARMTEEAARELGLDYTLEKVSDLGTMADMGVMVTPGLAVNGTVVAAGRLPTPLAVRRLIDDALK